MSKNGFKTTSIITPPTSSSGVVSPEKGDIVFDSIDNKLKIYDGTQWYDLTNQSNNEVYFRNQGDFSGQSSATLIPQFNWSSPTKLTNPDPSLGSASGGSISPNGEFLAVVTTAAINIYQRSGTTFTKLAAPATPPTGTGYSCSWSPNGEFLAVTHGTGIYLTIYQRSGTTFTKLANPTTLPSGIANSCSWSPNGEFLVVAHQTTPFISIYQRSGTTFTKLASPTLPTGTGVSCSWSRSGEYLAFGCNASAASLIVYKRSGTTFTVVLSAAFTGNGWAKAVSWSNNDSLLAYGLDVTPFLGAYSFENGVFTQLPSSNFSARPTSQVLTCKFSQDGSNLIVGNTTSPYLHIYEVSNTAFTRLQSPLSPVVSAMYGGEFSSDKQFAYATTLNSPYIYVYQTSSTIDENKNTVMKKIKRSGT